MPTRRRWVSFSRRGWWSAPVAAHAGPPLGGLRWQSLSLWLSCTASQRVCGGMGHPNWSLSLNIYQYTMVFFPYCLCKMFSPQNVSPKKFPIQMFPPQNVFSTKKLPSQTLQMFPPQNNAITKKFPLLNISTTKCFPAKWFHHKKVCITKYFHLKMFPPQNVPITKRVPLQNVSITKCFHHRVFPPQNVSITKCFNHKMLPLQNVSCHKKIKARNIIFNYF